MYPFSTLLFLFLCSNATATPLFNRKPDLDGNGVPDRCKYDQAGTARCIKPDGTWTVVRPSASAAPIHPLQTTTTIVSTMTTASSVSSTATSLSPSLPKGSLPSASQFKSDNGTKWKIEYVGDIQYTDQLQTKDLLGDKCRSSKLGDKVIWNCGDMMCSDDYTVCGFAMGPAMYGTDDVMTINTTGISQINP